MAGSDKLGRFALAIAIGAATVVVVTVGALAMPAARARLGFAPARTAAYAVGGRVDVPSAVYERSDYTVVLFARSTCAFCERAQPLFAKLAADLAEDPSARMVMVSAPSGGAGDAAYAKAIGLDGDRLALVDPASLRLKTVPTIVLTNRQGLIRYSHEGMPSAADLEELRHTIPASSPRR